MAADEGHDDQQARPIPADLWNELIEISSADDALGVGRAAYVHKHSEAAILAFRKAGRIGSEFVAPIAALFLGLLLKERGDLEGARAAYQQAIDSNHADAAPSAEFNLGNLLRQQNLLQDAQDAYKRAMASRDPRIAPVAALYLGRLLTDRGDTAGARVAYEWALDFGKEDIARKLEAAVRAQFAELQTSGGRPVHLEFLDVRRRRPDHEAIAAAALNLGNLLQDQGDIDNARTAYENAIEFGDADIAPKAASNLGIMLHLHGDVAGARAAYQRALDSGHPKVGPLTAFNLGFLLAQNGDVNGARKAYQRAIEFGDSEIAKDAVRRIQELGNQT